MVPDRPEPPPSRALLLARRAAAACVAPDQPDARPRPTSPADARRPSSRRPSTGACRPVIEHRWGPIWDAIPPEFLVFAGAQPVEIEEPVSAALDRPAQAASPADIANAYVTDLDDRRLANGRGRPARGRQPGRRRGPRRHGVPRPGPRDAARRRSSGSRCCTAPAARRHDPDVISETLAATLAAARLPCHRGVPGRAGAGRAAGARPGAARTRSLSPSAPAGERGRGRDLAARRGRDPRRGRRDRRAAARRSSWSCGRGCWWCCRRSGRW